MREMCYGCISTSCKQYLHMYIICQHPSSTKFTTFSLYLLCWQLVLLLQPWKCKKYPFLSVAALVESRDSHTEKNWVSYLRRKCYKKLLHIVFTVDAKVVCFYFFDTKLMFIICQENSWSMGYQGIIPYFCWWLLKL